MFLYIYILYIYIQYIYYIYTILYIYILYIYMLVNKILKIYEGPITSTGCMKLWIYEILLRQMKLVSTFLFLPSK